MPGETELVEEEFGDFAYAFAREVDKKVALQVWQMMFMAAAFCTSCVSLLSIRYPGSTQDNDVSSVKRRIRRTVLSCDLGPAAAFLALRSRFCAALAPYLVRRYC